MDDLGKGVGKGIGGLSSCALASVALVVVALLVLALAVPGLAADKKDKDKKAASKSPIATLKGKDYRMADTKMADKVTRYADPAGDQLWLDGMPAPAAPKWSDIESVYVARTRTPAKLHAKMTSDYPPGSANAIYGDREHGYSELVVFVAVKMARKLPASSRGQQVEIGLSGDAATPVQNGTDTVTWAGTESFTLAGRFSNGAFAAAATDVSGRQPGLELEPGEYYGIESGTFGFYRPRNATWYLVVPRADDTEAITVSVRSSTGEGSVIDRLDLPGGGHFVTLDSLTGGYQPNAGLSPLTCRALETFNGESGTIEGLDLDSNLIRYTAGLEPTADAATAAKLLGEALAAVGPVNVALSEPGSEAEPMIVPAQLAEAEEGNAIRLTFEAPAGQWTFGLADELKLKTPAGEHIVDVRTLTGPAGVQVGPGLDGYVAGDRACAPSAVAEDAEAAALAAAEAEAAAPAAAEAQAAEAATQTEDEAATEEADG